MAPSSPETHSSPGSNAVHSNAHHPSTYQSAPFEVRSHRRHLTVSTATVRSDGISERRAQGAGGGGGLSLVMHWGVLLHPPQNNNKMRSMGCGEPRASRGVPAVHHEAE